MKATLAIYDMDRTVTRGPTFGPFLWHAMWRLAPWRGLLAPLSLLATLGYALKFYDRGRLKEMNYRLLVGPAAPEKLEPVVQSFAAKQLETNILEGARARIAEDKAAGGRGRLAPPPPPPPTGSTPPPSRKSSASTTSSRPTRGSTRRAAPSPRSTAAIATGWASSTSSRAGLTSKGLFTKPTTT